MSQKATSYEQIVDPDEVSPIARTSAMTSDESSPLSATKIKIAIMEKGDTIAELARRWSTEETKITSQEVSRVINRVDWYVYQEIRQLLADYLGVDVSRVGRDRSNSNKPETAVA